MFEIIGINGKIENLGLLIVDLSIELSETSVYHIGVLAGLNHGTITNCYASGNLTYIAQSDIYMGGLVGKNCGTISNSYSIVNASEITSTSAYVGGLVGYNEGNIEGSIAYGNVLASGSTIAYSYASGLVGYTRVLMLLKNVTEVVYR